MSVEGWCATRIILTISETPSVCLTEQKKLTVDMSKGEEQTFEDKTGNQRMFKEIRTPPLPSFAFLSHLFTCLAKYGKLKQVARMPRLTHTKGAMVEKQW